MRPDLIPPPWETLAAYLYGTLSDVERVTVERQIAADPRLTAAMARLRRAMEASAPVLDASGLERELQRLRRNMLAGGSARRTSLWAATPGGARATLGATVARWGWPTLAALAVVVAVTVVGWSVSGRRLNRHEATSTLTYTTGRGERANISLPDGSTVALDVASRLDVPADYAAGHHVVHLVGEALFTVMHHGGTPFMVTAGGTTARVLGTSFVVRRYPRDTTVMVAVRDGRVAVRSVVVTAAHRVDVNEAGVARVRRADSAQFSFVKGVLTLEGVPLRDAVVELNRWYNTDIRLGDAALGAQQVTGEFTAGSLSDLAETLQLTFNVRVVREGRILTVYPR